MNPKKSDRADLERWRGFFFLAGLALALFVSIILLQWKQEVALNRTDCELPPVYTVDVHMPITKIEVPEKKRPSPQAEVIKPQDLLPPESKPRLKVTATKNNAPTEAPVEIGFEPEDERPEVIEHIYLKHLAVPIECTQAGSAEEQKKCLNDWLQNYLKNNIRFPERARKLNLEGKVYVNFIISETGEVEQVETLHGEYEILNQEAERVLRSMPVFKPARQMGQKVRMSMTIPVNFTRY